MKSSHKNIIFLLGGHDLEMHEIKKILVSKSFRFFDANLSWNNAKLSSYKTKINNTDLFYGIELETDINPPKLYQLIDHHNENSHKLSCIEQVAEILGIQLNRDQLLVAANDKGYIPAMEEMGASKKEMDDIRRRDRAAQGVSEGDERLAEKSIAENQTNIGDLIQINSLTTHFSTITDRLYPYKELLISYKKEMVYYGSKSVGLAKKYEAIIKEKKAFVGGGMNGYFGINEKNVTETEAKLLYKEVFKYIINMNTHSYHIFMFPFTWEFENKNNKNLSFDERYDLSKIKVRKESQWDNSVEQDKDEKRNEEYNEKNYFYKFVHQTLFDKNDDSQTYKTIDLKHFQRKEIGEKKLFYEIGLLDAKPYTLLIEDITLDLFPTGAGVLCFQLSNITYSELSDIKKINEFGRRIFPPFLGKTNGVEAPKKDLLADYIKIIGLNVDNNEHDRYSDDFCQYDYSKFLQPAKFIKNLILDLNENLTVFPVIDDRMFSMCWTFNSMYANIIKQKEEYLKFLKSDLWHEYLYVDGKESTCQNDEMQERLLNEHTYPRWQKYGTLYGITRYSFMAISDESDYSHNIIFNTFRTIYAKMVMLTLSQRASILKFSGEVTTLSDINQKNIDKEADKIDSFYKAYVKFINKVYHREITAQEQGIELLDMLQDNLRIGKQTEGLKKEIIELNSYVNLLKGKQTSDRLKLLSILGALIVIPNFLINLIGSRFFKELPELNLHHVGSIKIDSLVFLIVIIICSTSTMVGLFYINKKEFKRKGLWLLIISGLVLVFYLIFFQFTIGKMLF